MHGPSICCFFETRVSDDRHDNLRFGANWAAKCIPAIGGTAVLWRRDRLHLEGFWEDRQVCMVSDFGSGVNWLLAAARNRGIHRRILWRQCTIALEYGFPVIGDFHIIRKEEEGKGPARDI